MTSHGGLDREAITAGASLPAGPYSHAIRGGDLLFIAGHGPADRGQPGETTLAEQALAMFDNLSIIAAAAGGDINDMVRPGANIADYTKFAEYNEIMRGYLKPPYFARTTIPVPTRHISIGLDAAIALAPPGSQGAT